VRVGVLGAGAIGAYVGGLLAEAGCAVTLVGRPALCEAAARAGGVRIADPGGRLRLVPGARPSADPADLAGSDLAIVAVKSTGTSEAAEALARVLPERVPVLSLQNGVRNVALLTARLGEGRVKGGMIACNVVREDDASFRRTTSGPVRIAGPEEVAARLRARGLDAALERDMAAVQWAKLVFNTNNAIVALTGLPLGASYLDPDARAVYRAAMREGLVACAAEGIAVRGFGRLRPALVVRLLALPSVVLRRLLGAVIRVGAEARSSMWEDLVRRRPTEIDHLNGEIAALGARRGVPTPVNAALVALVREAERAAAGPPDLPARELRRRVGIG
jgi:2-dehydropantoate 2-reductase